MSPTLPFAEIAPTKYARKLWNVKSNFGIRRDCYKFGTAPFSTIFAAVRNNERGENIHAGFLKPEQDRSASFMFAFMRYDQQFPAQCGFTERVTVFNSRGRTLILPGREGRRSGLSIRRVVHITEGEV
jgi:hypothetical protein